MAFVLFQNKRPYLFDRGWHTCWEPSQWLYDLRNQNVTNSPHTQRDYAYILGDLLSWCEDERKTWRSLSVSRMSDYFGSFEVSNDALNKRIGVVFDFYLWAQSRGFVRSLPFEVRMKSSRRPRCSSKRRIGRWGAGHEYEPILVKKRLGYGASNRVEIPSVEQTWKFRESMPTDRYRLMTEIFMFTGLRVNELVNLTVAQIATVQIGKSNRSVFVTILGKGNKERLVPFPRALVLRLQQWIKLQKDFGNLKSASSDLIFAGVRGSLSTRAVQKFFKRVSHECKLHVIESAVRFMGINQHDNVIDPACGTGGFLFEAYQNLKAVHPGMQEADRKGWAMRHLYGIDKDSINVKLTKALMIAIGDGSTNIYNADSLRVSSWATKYPRINGKVEDNAFSCAITNPPFGKNLTFKKNDGDNERYNICRVSIRNGHGSPSQDQRVGDVPYVKVSDLRAGTVNINPTNMIPQELAQDYWNSLTSGIKAYDLISPERASKNIGEFCVLMPGQEQIVLTKEVLVARALPDAPFDQFFLMWALSLSLVRDQWRRIVFFQTNREDVGKRYLEIRLPIPDQAKEAKDLAESFKRYFENVQKSRKALSQDLEKQGYEHHIYFV